MFFVISKLIGLATTPSTLLMLIGLLGIAFMIFGRRRTGIALCVTSIFLTLAFG